MITISLCMIVRDEEDVIARCLDSVKDVVDEIIITDTGSVDNTKEVVKTYTSLIYDFEWIDDFSAARNFSFSKASMDYIFWLDADDVLPESDRMKLKNLKESLDPNIDGVMMRYNTGFDESGNPLISCYRQRLVKRTKYSQWQEPVHEYLPTTGNIAEIDICINHCKLTNKNPSRNCSIFDKYVMQNKELSTRGMYYYARELYFAKELEKSKDYLLKYFEKEDAWNEDKIIACLFLAQCYHELGNEEERMMALLRSFTFVIPRTEICCEIGKCFIEKKQYDKAIYWLKYALQLEAQGKNWGFTLHDYFGFIPNIQLCLCYDRLGNFEEAKNYNDKAAEYRPDNPHVIHNREYFESKLNQPQ